MFKCIQGFVMPFLGPILININAHMEGFKNNSMLIEQYSVDVSVRCEGID
jgi:hypothetical protein